MATVLLVDDDEMVVYALSRYLRRSGLDVIEASNGKEAIARINEQLPDIVVTDIIMPEMEGIGFIMHLQKNHPDLPIIAMSGGSRRVDTSHLETAMALGAIATFEKPFDEEEMVATIRKQVGI